MGSHTPPIGTDRENTRQTDGRTDGIYIKPRITRSGASSARSMRARATSRARRPGGATHLDDDDGVDDDDDDGDDETVEIDACDDWPNARATRCGSRAAFDDDRRGTHHVR